MSRTETWPLTAKRRLLRFVLLTGVALFVPASLWLIAGMLNLLPTEAAAIAGYSGLRVIGSVAVGGCLLAAIGSADI
jgi:hypothetical protein